jgi:hypothetical protein
MRLLSKSLVVLMSTFPMHLPAPAPLAAQERSPVLNTSVELPEAPRPQTPQSENRSEVSHSAKGTSSSIPEASGQALTPITGGHVSGTVLDVNGDLIPGVTVVLTGPRASDRREVVANDSAMFQFDGLKADVSYRVSIRAEGFADWATATITLTPGQFVYLKDIHLKIEEQQTSVTVYASTAQIATEQVRIEEQQRVLGFIPNFYVVYDSKNAAPLTAKLKFKLAFRVMVDPVTVGGVALMSSIYQAADTPDYVQGAKGYGQRFGTIAADGSSDILIGGAILPSLLHQDPRYFYQGTGTTKSRVMHAIFSPFICRGDNGRWQPNYSSVGGDLASSALSNIYYPQSNRGPGLVFGSFAIGTAERMLSGFGQEFIFPRLTTNIKK